MEKGSLKIPKRPRKGWLGGGGFSSERAGVKPGFQISEDQDS